jgi:hypothetical protein
MDKRGNHDMGADSFYMQGVRQNLTYKTRGIG